MHAYVRYRAVSEEIQEKISLWQNLCDEFKVCISAVAIAFCLLPACVSAVVIGVKSSDELSHTLGSFQIATSDNCDLSSKERVSDTISSDNDIGSCGSSSDFARTENNCEKMMRLFREAKTRGLLATWVPL